jgi:probable rRNA maturation factor
VDDREMRTVNRTFHGVDEPTDVLAFPLDRGGPRPARGRGFAGEVVVSLDTARREAAWRGVAPSAELLLYVVHGVLHLLGEDDHAPAAARRMHLRTLAILSALGEANTIEIPRARRGLRTPL